MNIISKSPSIPFVLKPINSKWAVPAGEYRARVRTVTESECDTDGAKKIRFVFDVIEDVNGPVEKLAKTDYTTGTPSYDQLQKDLAAFFDPSEIQTMRATRTEVDLHSLVGREVDLLISNFTAKGHDEPYSKIDRIERPGKYVPNSSDQFDCDDLMPAI